MTKTTIKDVAKAAGVSPSTVSRALRNSDRISEKVRLHVQRIAREMDFHPNQMARSLVSRETRIIGVVFPDDAGMNLGNPFYPAVLQGLGHAAGEARYHVLLITGSESVTAAEASRAAVDSGYVSGLILLTAVDAPPPQAGVPVVIIGHPTDADKRCCVDNDNIRAGYEAAKHLIGKVHRRIALLGYDSRYMFTVDRRSGVLKALEEAGLDLCCCSGDCESLLPFFHSQERPTAVVCMDDQMAIGLSHALTGIGLRIPEDVSLISFNNTELGRCHQPPLTTFDVQPYQLGVQAMKLMLGVIRGEETAPVSVEVPFTLVPRGSVADLTQRSETNA